MHASSNAASAAADDIKPDLATPTADPRPAGSSHEVSLVDDEIKAAHTQNETKAKAKAKISGGATSASPKAKRKAADVDAGGEGKPSTSAGGKPKRVSTREADAARLPACPRMHGRAAVVACQD
jgi:hypothetical protein